VKEGIICQDISEKPIGIRQNYIGEFLVKLLLELRIWIKH